MIGLDVDVFFLLYLGAGFLLIFGLWLYYDQRDSKQHEAERMKVVYHCIKCGEIYTGSHTSIESQCPQCSFINGRLGF